MAAHSGSVEPVGSSGQRIGADSGAADRRPQRGGRSLPGWFWLIVAVAVGAGKTDAFLWIVHHRIVLIVALGLGFVGAVLRGRPVWMAGSVAGALGLALAGGSVVQGVAIGIGSVVLLLTLFAATGTVLDARAKRRLAGRRRAS